MRYLPFLSLFLAPSLFAGTIGTIYRPNADRVTYTAATLPTTSAPSSAVYCSDCRRNARCSAGAPGIRMGAMAFTPNGTGDWVCNTGVSSEIPDSFIPAISGLVCIDRRGDPANCVFSKQIAKRNGQAWRDFWEYWQRRVVNVEINRMREKVCAEDLPTCDDRPDRDARDAAVKRIRDRDLPSE